MRDFLLSLRRATCGSAEIGVFVRTMPFFIEGSLFMFRQTWIAVLLLLPLAPAAPALAAGEGQEDLDKATETKLTADSIDDLGEVIRLIESALQKGLDESNAAFANKLLASTFIQRAQETIENLFVNVASMDDFRRRRRFALDDLEKAVKLDPKQPQAYLMIARLNLLPGGDGAKAAREALDKALALDIENPMERAKALVMRAGLQEEPKKKLVDLDEAVRLAPGSAAVVRARGLALADMDKLEPALADLDKAIALAPDDGPTYEAKAIVLARLKKYDEALAALERAQEINPGSAAPLLQRARVHVAQKKSGAALQDLDKALAVQPDNVMVLLLRAGIYQEMGKKEKALADVDKALEIRPGLIAAIRTRALLLAEDERLDEAAAELQKLRENDPNDLLTLLQLGMIYSVQKKSDKAVEAYSTILAAQPDLWQALRGRGDAYLNLGKHAEAIADYEKAMKLEPNDHGILNNLAWVLATSPDDKLRDGKRAIRLATEACETTDYKLAHVLSTLAAAYAETGDFDSAVQWSTKAVELDDKEHGDEIKKELESYKAKKPWRELLSEEKAEK